MQGDNEGYIAHVAEHDRGDAGEDFGRARAVRTPRGPLAYSARYMPDSMPTMPAQDGDAGDDQQRADDLVGQPAAGGRGRLGQDAPAPNGHGTADDAPQQPDYGDGDQGDSRRSRRPSRVT